VTLLVGKQGQELVDSWLLCRCHCCLVCCCCCCCVVFCWENANQRHNSVIASGSSSSNATATRCCCSVLVHSSPGCLHRLPACCGCIESVTASGLEHSQYPQYQNDGHLPRRVNGNAFSLSAAQSVNVEFWIKESVCTIEASHIFKQL
jgi:hypothetical protein